MQFKSVVNFLSKLIIISIVIGNIIPLTIAGRIYPKQETKLETGDSLVPKNGLEILTRVKRQYAKLHNGLNTCYVDDKAYKYLLSRAVKPQNKTELKSLKETIDQLNIKVKNLNDEKQNLTTQLTNVNKNATSISLNINNLQDKLSKITNENDQLKTELKTMKETNNLINSEKSKMLNNKNDELNDVNVKIQNVQNQLDNANAMIKNHEAEKLQKLENNNLKQNVEKLMKEIKHLRETIDKLNRQLTENESNKKSHTSEVILNIINESTKELNGKKEEYMKQLKAKETELEKARLELKRKDKEIKDLEDKLIVINVEKLDLDMQLQDMKQEKEQLEFIIDKFQSLDTKKFIKTIVDAYTAESRYVSKLNKQIVDILGNIEMQVEFP